MEILNNYLPTTYHKITASIITILLVQRIIKKLFFTRSVQQTFQSKRIIITGASSGIGEELAYQIVKNGAKSVSLCARRVEELQRVAKKCKELSPGVEANIIELDVTDLDSCKYALFFNYFQLIFHYTNAHIHLNYFSMLLELIIC